MGKNVNFLAFLIFVFYLLNKAMESKYLVSLF